MSSQVVPHQEHAQGCYVGQQADAGFESLPPPFPYGSVFLGTEQKRRRGQGLEDRSAFFFPPGMQDRIRPTENSFDMDGVSRCMEQHQPFGRPVADVFMGLRGWLSFPLPTAPRIEHGLRGSRFIGIPDRQSQTLSYQVRPFDQGFFCHCICVPDRHDATFALA